ncbi:MAG: lytic transglycosylase domain-containing protein [Chromatiaceae bacterium]|jgi:soluble lytic murein transglycosylase-like protein
MGAIVDHRRSLARRLGFVLTLAVLVALPVEARQPRGSPLKLAAGYKAAFARPAGLSRAHRAKADGDREVRRHCAAAKKGDSNAQFDLGYVYALGRGVKRDDALAAGWFKKAAAQGHPQARNWLKLLRVRPRSKPECILSDGRPLGAKRKFAPNPAKGPIVDLVRSLAPEYQLDPNLVLAVVEAESNFNPGARSYKNAQGLMQLIPETAERFGVADVWDPEQNLRGGMAYLRWLLDHFDGDVWLALAGYNAGERAVERYKGVPPYDETREYVSRIAGRLTR